MEILVIPDVAQGGEKNKSPEQAYASVSVIVPCYRCASTIERAVASIAQQTLKPTEVILVDDASGDDTLVVLQQLAQAYPDWIKIIVLNENYGAACARNVGWGAATQPYIAFLDADDTWHPEKLNIQYRYLHDNPDVAVSGHQCILLRAAESLPKIPLNPLVTQVSPQTLLFKSCFSTPTVMLKKEIPLRFDSNKRYAEDLYLWQQIAFSGLQMTRLESPLAYVHKSLYGEGGLSAQLWNMEKGELKNLIDLYRQNKIKQLLFVAAISFSMAKYFKRLSKILVKRLFFC